MKYTNPIILSPASLSELAAIGRAITSLVEKIQTEQTSDSIALSILDDQQFDLEARAMREAFSDMPDDDLAALIDEAVQAVRHPSTQV